MPTVSASAIATEAIGLMTITMKTPCRSALGAVERPVERPVERQVVGQLRIA